YSATHAPHGSSFPTRRSSDLCLPVTGRSETQLRASAGACLAHRRFVRRREAASSMSASAGTEGGGSIMQRVEIVEVGPRDGLQRDRKSTRLNSSHVKISYAVF